MDNLEFEKKYRTSGSASQRRYPNEQTVQFLASHYFSLPQSKRRNVKVLELGCGGGANLWMVAKEGFDAYGVDIAPSSIALCKRMLKGYGVKAKLSTGNIKKLDFKNDFFDVILDVFTVEHTTLAGHRQAFTEAFRCLKHGGRLFSWHLGSKSINFTRGGGTKLDRYTVDNTPNTNVPYANNGITCFITAPLANKMLKEAGFTDISTERVTRTYRQMTQEVEYFAITARKA